MAVKASPQGDQVGEASTSPYPDVPYTHWAAGFVEAGVAAGLIDHRDPVRILCGKARYLFFPDLCCCCFSHNRCHS